MNTQTDRKAVQPMTVVTALRRVVTESYTRHHNLLVYTCVTLGDDKPRVTHANHGAASARPASMSHAAQAAAQRDRVPHFAACVTHAPQVVFAALGGAMIIIISNRIED